MNHLHQCLKPYLIPIRTACILLLVVLLCIPVSHASASGPSSSSSSFPPFRFNTFARGVSRHGHSVLATSNPTLHLYSKDKRITAIQSVKTKTKRKKDDSDEDQNQQRRKWSPIGKKIDASKLGGIYYGLSPRTIEQASQPGAKRPSLSDSMAEALDELRTLRQEMETIRKEMQTMKKKMIADGDFFEEETTAESDPGKVALAKRKRQREFDKISIEVERWAKKILYDETESDGWVELECNKMMVSSINKSGRTRAYMKWMKDSRGDYANKEDNKEYPCIKVYTTIDASPQDVCTYLSQDTAVPEYNDLVVKYKDVEEILPHSKIVWSQTPQILFIKPRDFITYCSHRWTRDGTQVIVNQATDHVDWPLSPDSKKGGGGGKSCRAYALRGANFISPCPDDPDKTRILIVAHANPGGDIAPWAVKTAVNALAPVEPFKLFHKINENVRKNQPKLRELTSQAEMVSSLPGGRSPRPGGISQLGYAAFWPNGGGMKEGALLEENSDGEQQNELSDFIKSAEDDEV